MSTKIAVKYLPDEQRAVWLFPGHGSSFKSISVWEWQPTFQATLDDFRISDDHYIDGNGDSITKEEAQAEVDYLNERA